jgi:hypothetical protein
MAVCHSRASSRIIGIGTPNEVMEMAMATTAVDTRSGRVLDSGASDGATSAVAWGAIIGGAFVIASIGLMLMALGSGFGLLSVSPWPNSGVSATTFGVMTAIWLIVVQWVSSGLGGYLTGRLRTRWTGLHTDESHFRDTAHGFLAWAVAAVITAAILASAVSALIGGVARGATTVAGNAVQGESQGAVQSGGSADATGYLVDSLFRRQQPDASGNSQEVRGEASRILLSGVRSGDVPAADKTYLAQLVSARTGLSQEDAQKRVDEVIAKAKEAETKARQAADAARKAATYLSLFTAFSMLIGAFIAAVAAKIGGDHRDAVPSRI